MKRQLLNLIWKRNKLKKKKKNKGEKKTQTQPPDKIHDQKEKLMRQDISAPDCADVEQGRCVPFIPSKQGRLGLYNAELCMQVCTICSALNSSSSGKIVRDETQIC